MTDVTLENIPAAPLLTTPPLATPAQITRHLTLGLYETLLCRDNSLEVFATITPLPHENLLGMLARLVQRMHQHNTSIVALTLFNGSAQREAAIVHLTQLLGPITFPITWLESEGAVQPHPVGVEVHALRGPSIQTLRLHNRVVGCAWEDDFARHCELGDLRDENTAREPAGQCQKVFGDMVAALAQTDMTFKDVYRTWFRNRDILAWYREFNLVRTTFYNDIKVFDGILPASTGISTTNPYDAALIAGLWAMVPKSSSPTPAQAYAVDSPLQDSACKYGSSFSRGVEVNLINHRRLTISGTASIDPAGKTVHVGDVGAQIDLTMRVVHAILQARSMDWCDVSRAIAYFRHPAEMPAFARWHKANHLVPLPILITNHTVCRDDLLYEIELDAVKAV